MSYIEETVKVECREPFEATGGYNKVPMRVTHYVVDPIVSLFRSQDQFEITGFGPVLTKSGAVHQGRQPVHTPRLAMEEVPGYVFEEAEAHFRALAEEQRKRFTGFADKVAANRPATVA